MSTISNGESGSSVRTKLNTALGSVETLSNNSMADTLHRHSELSASDGTPDPALSVDANGKVGIGTAAPSEKLHAYTAGKNIILSEGNGGSDYVEGAFYAKSNSSTRGAGLYCGNVANTIQWFAGQSFNGVDRFSINYVSGSFSTATADIANSKFVVLSTGNVGIGTTSPTSKLHVAGSVAKAIVAKTANYTATATDYTILVTCSSANVTITLPAASGCSGRIYNIKDRKSVV